MLPNPDDLPKQGPLDPRVGHDEHGIRLYYLPGDSPWRYAWDVARWQIESGKGPWQPDDTILGCNECGHVASLNDFDLIGTDDDKLFCPRCQKLTKPEDLGDTPPKKAALTFGSLFAGIGGFDLGFERAGMVCKWQVEIDEYCRKVLAKHWPDVRRHDDVRTFPPSNGDDWRVDCIIGGDPCQANSAAVGGGRSEHASLGGEFVRVVDALRPRIVVRENPTFARRDAPWPWWRMRSALESLGYAVLPFRLRACCFGAFHQRDRLFLLAESTDARSERLERGQTQTQVGDSSEPPRRIHASDWLAVSTSRGFGSRAGLPGYVERVRGIGNAVYPAVAEWIGRQIVLQQEQP